jgi:hypothetical protein
VGVEPRELVRSRAPEGDAQQLLVRVEHVELAQELLCFAPGLLRAEQDVAVVERPAGEGDELDDRLVRDEHRPVLDAGPQEVGRDPLLLRKAPVEAVDENIRVNESGHARTARRAASLARR